MKKFTLFAFLLTSVFAKAQEGFPDPSYGSGGYVSTVFNDPSFSFNSLTTFDNDGRMTAVKTIRFTSIVILLRYDNNGVIDYSLNGGAAVHDFAYKYSFIHVNAIYIQPNGKIVVAAAIFRQSSTMFASILIRFNRDGTFDDTFGINGEVQVPGGISQGTQTGIRNDGTIVVMLRSFSPPQFYTLLIDPEGKSAKTVFAHVPSLGISYDDMQPTTLFLQKDGKIVQAGRAEAVTSQRNNWVILKRLNLDGSPDSSFGRNDGIGVIPLMATPEIISVQSDGKIIAESEDKLYRFNLDGTQDFFFGNNGVVQVPFKVTSLLVQDDNKIIVGGNFGMRGANPHVLLARYEPNGISFDPSFGYGGMTGLALAAEPLTVGTLTVKEMMIAKNRIYLFGQTETGHGGYLAAFRTSTPTMTGNPGPAVQSRAIGEKIKEQELNAIVSPNPATTHFILCIQGSSNKPMQIRIYDAVGRTIELKRNIASGNALRLGDNYRPGVYFAEVVQGSEKKTLKLIKGSR